MSSDLPTESVTTSAAFVFQPPAGGDLTLQSCDGTTFRVHSVLLGLASTVFAGMLTGATKSDTVELAEDAETICLMLAFIYPVAPPAITTVEQLEKVMLSSQKYDIERTIKFIEGFDRLDNQLILSDPIRVFRASVKYKFTTIQAQAAKIFGLKNCNYRTLAGLEELARLLPESSGAIGLIGAQIVREEILKGIYTRTEVKPRCDPSSLDYSPYMSCSSCWNRTRRTGGSVAYYCPGWMACWIKQLHSRLIRDPMDPCEDLFGVESIRAARGNGADGCSACVTQTWTNCHQFGEWARGVKTFVDKELEALDKLYSL